MSGPSFDSWRLASRRLAGVALLCGVGLVAGCPTEPSPDPTWSGWPSDPIVESEPFGELPGSLDVSTRGQAQYEIPLRVAPGRNGIEPSLSLRYDSGGGNGILGIGFDLVGVPAPVRRCPSSDRDNSQVNWRGQSFCMGGERLVPVTVAASDVEYRTRGESFRRVRALGPRTSPTSFVVEQRDGTTIHFERQAPVRQWENTQTEAHGASMEPNTSLGVVVAEWLPTRLVDRSGNERLFDWAILERTIPDGSELEVRLSRIRYHGDREIRFAFDSRPDFRTMWQNGVARSLQQRLITIEVLAPSVPGSVATVQWRYRIEYERSRTSGRSRVVAVRRCDAADVCLRPTRFEWSDASETILEEDVDPTRTGGPWDDYTVPVNGSTLVGDFDGDGREDVIVRALLDHITPAWWLLYSRADGFEPGGAVDDIEGQSDARALVVDLNGDGRSELLVARDFGQSLGWKLYGVTPDGFTSLAAIHDTLPGARASAADFDGNGTVDLAFYRDGFMPVQVLHGSGSYLAGGFGAPRLVNCGFMDFFNGDEPVDTLVTDLDGDGRREITQLQTQGSRRCDLGGTGSVTNPGLFRGNGVARTEEPPILTDLNGDGLADWTSVTLGVTRINTGRGFGPWHRWRPSGLYPATFTRDRSQTWSLDWNRDGLQDLAWVLAESGEPARSGILLNDGRGGWTAGAAPAGFEVVLDYDGDGFDDLLGADWHVRRRRPAAPDRIIAVTRGFGARDEIAYGSLAAVALEDAPFASHPLSVGNRRMQVVQQLRLDDGLPRAGSIEPHVISYSYGAPRRDMFGNAFLGFTRMRIDDPRLGRVEELVFDGLETEGIQEERNLLRQLTRYRYPFAGSVRERVVAVTDAGRTRITRRTFAREEVVRPLGLSRTFEERPLSSTTSVFEVAQSEWEGCVAAFGGSESLAGADLDVGLTCPATTRSWIRARRLRFEDYDELSHPRRVIEERLVPGGTTPLRTTVTETFFQDYSGGPAYTGAVPQSARVATWLLDLPDFIRVSDTARVAGSPETRVRVDRFLWNGRGELIAHVREPGLDPASPALGAAGPDTGSTRLTTTFAYSTFGNVERIERAAETGEIRFDDFGYDEDDVHLRWSRNAAGHLSYVGVHPAFGAPVVAVDPNGVRDLYQFDGFGRLRSEALAGGAGRTVSYGNRRVTETPNGGGQRVVTFDRLGRAVGTSATGFAGATRTSGASFDDRGMLASITRPSTPSSRGAVVLPAFDQLGRLTSLRTRSRPGGPEVLRETRRYLAGGDSELSIGEVEAVEVTEADGDQRRLHVGADGSITRSTERNELGGHSAVRFDSGPFGLLAATQDPEGNILSIEHDALGRPTRVVDPDRGVFDLTYSAFDEIASVSREEVGTTVFTRDALGRTLFESNGSYIVAYDYDVAPNGVGRLAASEAPGGIREEYEYDGDGRPRRIRYIRGAFEMLVDFDFDAAGRVSSVTYPEVDGERLEVRYHYDVNSGVLFRIESEGLEVDWELRSHDGYVRTLVERAAAAVVEHEYDPVFGIETRTVVRAGTSPTSPIVHDVEVVPSVDGNVRGRRDNVRGRAETFAYDRRDRLVGWTSLTGTGASRLERRVNHTYSDGGRLLSVTDREQVGGGAFSTVAAESYVYEPGVRGAGPRAATEQVVVSGTSSSSTLFGYESGRQTAAGGRAVSYTHFDLPSVVSDTTTRIYDYDADRHRARVREPQGETVVYAGSFYERRMTSQAAGDNVVFVYGPGGLLAQLRRSDGAPGWSTEYVHGDHLGSATVTTDPAGNIVSEQWFGPFGRRLDDQGRDLPRGTGVPDALRVGFTGHEQEDAVGLVDMQGRFYDPTQRRFLTPDPLIPEPTATQSWSPYAYVRNNPLSRVDPSGWGDEDLSGFEDEGAWDTAGLDDYDEGPGGGGDEGPGGGDGPDDYDDFDEGDIDFDPGEGAAGQDEEAANDGTDDYSDSGSGGSDPSSRFDHEGSSFVEVRRTERVDFVGGRGRDYAFQVGLPRTVRGLGGATYRSQSPGPGFTPRGPTDRASDDPDTSTDESEFWRSHLLFSTRAYTVTVTVRWLGEGAPPAVALVQHGSYVAIRDPEVRGRSGGPAIGVMEQRQGYEERSVRFEGNTATTTFRVSRTGTWNAERFSVTFTDGMSVTVMATVAR